MFRTPSKGWGVRSWDTIPSGAPICEYTGILTKTDDMDNIADNSYIFEIDCLQTMKGLDGREVPLLILVFILILSFHFIYVMIVSLGIYIKSKIIVKKLRFIS